jgi:citrate synthase
MGTERAGGLEGVVVGDTELSHVDGEAGRLVVRGLDVEALAREARFEDVCGLLWDGSLPDHARAAALRAALGAARVDAFARLPALGGALHLRDGMDALRAATAQLDARGSSEEVRLRLTGALPVFAAAWLRTGLGEDPLEPDSRRAHADDTLRMMSGRDPEPERVAALDAYLVTVADHGMNASTFTARVVASTESDAVSAVVAGLGALKGPAHGGAPGPVLDMLEEIGKPERARAWLESRLESGARIMGMGHRVYRARDPRAAVLERATLRLEAAGLAPAKLELARAVERAALEVLRARRAGRTLACNVEFYTAVLLDALGIPRALFTPTFAVARVAGWLAHIDEQRRTGRLIRPSVRYVGPLPGPGA